MGAWIDRTGQVIEAWTFVGGYERVDGKSYWVVRCRCGFEALRDSYNITSRKSKSCGNCGYNKTQPLYNTPTYRTWHSMKQRCLNPNNKRYEDYGGRGITIAPEWIDFNGFVEDMGVRPSVDHSLDRIDNNKGYCKENCKWSDRYQQQANQRVGKNNEFGVRGVQFDKARQKYKATLRFKGEKVLNKRFDTLEEAIEARKQAEEHYYKLL